MGVCVSTHEKDTESKQYDSVPTDIAPTDIVPSDIVQSESVPYIPSGTEAIYVIGFNVNGELGTRNQRNHDSLTLCNTYNSKKKTQTIFKSAVPDDRAPNHKCITSINSVKDYTIYSDKIHQNFWFAGHHKDVYGTGNPYYTTLTPIRQFKQKDVLIDKICSTVHSNQVYWISSSQKAYYQNAIIEKLTDVIDIQSTSKISYALCGCYKLSIIVNKWYENNNSDNIMLQIPDDVMNLIIIMYQGSVNQVFKGSYSTVSIRRSNVYRYSSSLYETKEKWGWELFSKLTKKNVMKIACRKDEALFLDSRGVVWSCSHDDKIPKSMEYFMENDIKIIDIKCGENYSVAIDFDGKIYSWGNNADGQLGLGTTVSIHIPQIIQSFSGMKIVKIECGRRHSYAMTEDNRHFLWGNNYFNECIMEDVTQKNVTSPHCIDEIVGKVTRGKMIKSVCLGGNNTLIIVC